MQRDAGALARENGGSVRDIKLHLLCMLHGIVHLQWLAIYILLIGVFEHLRHCLLLAVNSKSYHVYHTSPIATKGLDVNK